MPDTSDPAHIPDTAPLKVLIGCDTFPPDVNGAANFASRLAAGLVQRGHEVVVAAPAASRRHGRFVEDHEGASFPVERMYSWRWYPHDWLRFVLPWRSRAHAARILDEVKPDVVHIQSHIVVGRGMAREAHKRGIRVIATNHFMPENMIEHTLLPKFLRQTAIRLAWRDASRTFALCEAVTTPTRKAAAFLEAETELRGVHAISCGIDASLYTPSLEPRSENRIVFVGRVTGEKHIDVLLRAVASLDAKLDVKLDIVGGGDQMNQLKQLATTLGIRSNVNFTGYVSDEELRGTLTHATLFAMPSIAELQSIATMEAMASGLPIVAADAMALPHLVHNGENGFLFTPGDSADLAEKLTKVLRMPQDELLKLKQASLKLIEAHDIQRTLNTFESLYRGEAVTDPVTDVSLDGSAS
ncbi:glycosyltransferase involved in cell wall biosynthesis [Homoserinimonas aerilata]|uniref:D-inositol 3-phosphate glycosyltransferase n=1 Tax=Homoserinimonas aerilata TaxID=1162970 RepID=A0A542YIR6_9MICO|nr:glycosyltransferase [Homoserinimonas aerilata]TQL47874.1 glycosyltransferase involved in cell wall biosynthesis [Homoserinimonas aerilata]